MFRVVDCELKFPRNTSLALQKCNFREEAHFSDNQFLNRAKNLVDSMSNFKYIAFNQMLRESSQRSDYFECTCSQLNFPFSNFESLGSKEG